MPRRHDIQAVELLGWVGGLNREADPYQLEPTESPDALNVDFGLRGEVTKRNGFASYATDAAMSEHIFVWNDDVVFVREGGAIRYLVGTTSTDSLQAFTPPPAYRQYAVVAASMNDYLYLTAHRGDSPIRWDGTTWTAMTPTDFDGTSSTFPRARAVVPAHNRFFAGNVADASGVASKSRIFFSDVLDPETWQALNFFDVEPDNGQEITGMMLFGDQIFVFKDRSIYALVGTNELEFDVFPVDDSIGTQAPGTITNVGLRMFFFDHLKGVYMFDGQGFGRVSDKINTYLLDGVNTDEIHKAKGWSYRNRYYLSVPWGASTTNSRTFVYDPLLDAWTEYDLGFADAALLETTPLAVGVNGLDDIMQLFTTSQDNGVDIDGYMKTAWLSPGSPSVKHRLRRVDMTLSALGDYDVDIVMRRDFLIDAYVTKSVNTDTSASSFGSSTFGSATFGVGADQLMFRDSGWGQRWRSCQLEFAERSDGAFQINRAILMVSANVRSRGDH